MHSEMKNFKGDQIFLKKGGKFSERGNFWREMEANLDDGGHAESRGDNG